MFVYHDRISEINSIKVFYLTLFRNTISAINYKIIKAVSSIFMLLTQSFNIWKKNLGTLNMYLESNLLSVGLVFERMHKRITPAPQHLSTVGF